MTVARFKSQTDVIKKIIAKPGVTIRLNYEPQTKLAQMGEMYVYKKKEKLIVINVPELGAANKLLVLDIIRSVHEQGEIIWKESRAEPLSSYEEYNSENRNKAILSFFESILPTDDFIALKLSLFLRSEAEKGKKIYNLKNDIYNRFGERGGNISNLCSAGYFDKGKELETLYKKAPQEFNKYYEMVVGAKARALFVHNKMTDAQLEKEINGMVEKAIKYAMTDFRVHGKGKTNVDTILRFAHSRSNTESYRISKAFHEPTIPALEYTIQVIRDTQAKP